MTGEDEEKDEWFHGEKFSVFSFQFSVSGSSIPQTVRFSAVSRGSAGRVKVMVAEGVRGGFALLAAWRQMRLVPRVPQMVPAVRVPLFVRLPRM